MKLLVYRFRIFIALGVLLVGFFTSLSTPVVALNDKYNESFYSLNNILFYNPQDVIPCQEGGDLSGKDNPEKIWNYLRAQKLSPEQTAGVLGNIQVESGGTFSPTINEFSKKFDAADGDNGGYGIVQWTNSMVVNHDPPPDRIPDPNGRRSNVVKSLTKSLPELMKKYYVADYSSRASYPNIVQGYVSKNATTGEFMPVEDNDALLKAELDFLVDESKARTLRQYAVDKGYGTKADKEWDVLKSQKTVKDASNVWVYSFEFPGDIEKTAEDRATIGETILKTYSSGDTGDSDSEEESATPSCGGSGEAVHPIADGTRVNEGYGGPRPRVGTVTCGGILWHNGYDLQASLNTTVVKSSMDGEVTNIDYGNSALDTVSIRNPDGFTIRYMHMNKGFIDVKVGEKVTAGQPIGKSGNGNAAFEPHLHIEVDVTGNTNPDVAKLPSNLCGIKSVDPNDFFKIFGVNLCPNGGCDNPRTVL